MSEEFKTYCSNCGGSGFVQFYDGTGHRMQAYPFAEKTALVYSGECPVCDNKNKRKKPMTAEQRQEYKAKLDAKHDKIIAAVAADWAERKRELNERREAAGLPPI